MRSRYGEICRIKYGKRLYILTSHKVQLFQVLNTIEGAAKKTSESSCCFLTLEISTKTAKKSRGKGHKHELKYSLINSKENVLPLVRAISQDVKNYLNVWQPTFVCIGFYGRYKEARKRERLYTKCMLSYGYEVYETTGNFVRDTHIVYINKLNKK